MTRKQQTEFERVLPHSLEAERSVLGAVLIHNDAFDIAARIVTPEDFYRDAHRRIFQAMKKLLERPGGAVDYTTLMEQIKRAGDAEEVGGAAYIASLVDGVPRATNVRHYAGIVKDKAVLRALIYAGNKIVSAGYEGDQEAEEILSDADATLLSLRRGRRSSNVHSVGGRTGELFKVLEQRSQNRGQLIGVPTGWQSVDTMTMGWRPGNLIIVAARPSIGKSGLALGTCRSCCESFRADGARRRALVASMEMTKEELLSLKDTGDDPSDWAREATQWAKQTGVFTGDSAGNFGWQQPVTREAVAKLLYEYDQARNVDSGAADMVK